MILFLYNVLLLLALVLSSPWWLFRMASTQKYREGLWERLGFVRPLPDLNRRPLIWIHAVSVGEVLAISRLVSTLDAALPGHRVAISTTTRTGQALARERFGNDRVFYFPLDLPWAVSAYLKERKPVMVILAETEFWPNFLTGCYRRRIPVVVVNARVSDRSWPRYQKLRVLWKPFLQRLTAVAAQSELDADRLRSLGAANISIAGNLKFDVRSGSESSAVNLIQQLRGDLRLLVAGSTLDNEEAQLLAAWPAILEAHPSMAMLLAPRHPERFAAVANLIQRSGFPWRRRSSLTPDSATEPLKPGEIVLLDSIGELASIYSLAAVAFIGGSLIPSGGHNPLEPAQFAVPIVMGRFYENFKPIVKVLLEDKAIAITSPQALAVTVTSLLSHSGEAKRMGSQALRVFASHAGATDRTALLIQTVLQGNKS